MPSAPLSPIASVAWAVRHPCRCMMDLIRRYLGETNCCSCDSKRFFGLNQDAESDFKPYPVYHDSLKENEGATQIGKPQDSELTEGANLHVRLSRIDSYEEDESDNSTEKAKKKNTAASAKAKAPKKKAAAKKVTPKRNSAFFKTMLLKSPLAQQQNIGPQSKRGQAIQYQLEVLDRDPHAKQCFTEMQKNEAMFCGEWAAFYHSYSYAALIYEVQAAVAKVLFQFESQHAPLPRIDARGFTDTPDVDTLKDLYETKFSKVKQDHHPEFRAVAISVMCSLCALGPEASPPVIFITGYSQEDLSFEDVLTNFLSGCISVSKQRIKMLAKDILFCSERHGLDVSKFGGEGCPSGKAGHLLQIFVKRKLVSRLAYAALPWGGVDKDREPIS